MSAGKIALRHHHVITLGRRQAEPGKLPLTGWARLSRIKQGMWNPWQPQPVKIAVDAWLEKMEGLSHWHPLALNEYLQGLVARNGQERRVYVVILAPTGKHDRLPRVVSVNPPR